MSEFKNITDEELDHIMTAIGFTLQAYKNYTKGDSNLKLDATTENVVANLKVIHEKLKNEYY